MIEFLTSLFLGNPKILILGFGKEGRSTYDFFRKCFPDLLLGIADKNTSILEDSGLLDNNISEIFTGSNYQNSLSNFDIIIKSPGVVIENINSNISKRITSQTDLFLQCYYKQIIGITGTKGKSTTSSLIKHFIKADNKEVLLVGNIGVPAFDMIDSIKNDTIIVYELSAHQLEYLRKSPHIAVLLNVFPEHLDYFNSFADYKKAKFNICKFQNEDNCLIVHDSLIDELETIYIDLPESVGPGRVAIETKNHNKNQKIIKISDNVIKHNTKNPPLLGDHNLININAALLAVAEAGVDTKVAINSLSTFKSLPHRLENIGEFGGIRFVNDSISTIPQSTIAAVEALGNVDTLILGGFDRGLDYSELVKFLIASKICNFIFLGKAGDRMFDIFKLTSEKNLFKVNSIENAFEIIVEKNAKGSTCLLSPAAASYDQFHNFEHRGDVFRALALKL